eukprot:5257924-Prymnesium_polylepis.2
MALIWPPGGQCGGTRCAGRWDEPRAPAAGFNANQIARGRWDEPRAPAACFVASRDPALALTRAKCRAGFDASPNPTCWLAVGLSCRR